MGQASKVKSVKKAQLVTSSNESPVEITDKVKLSGDNKVEIDLKAFDSSKLSQSSNVIAFEFEGASSGKTYVNKTFEVKMKLSPDVEVKVS